MHEEKMKNLNQRFHVFIPIMSFLPFDRYYSQFRLFYMTFIMSLWKWMCRKLKSFSILQYGLSKWLIMLWKYKSVFIYFLFSSSFQHQTRTNYSHSLNSLIKWFVRILDLDRFKHTHTKNCSLFILNIQ